MPNMSEQTPNISKFAEKIRYDGVSRQARYYVELAIPNVVASNYSGEDLGMINLMVEQTMFPEFVVATQQVRSHSNPIEMPYDRVFGPVTMTFLCDRKMTIKHFFDMWAQSVYNTFGGVLNYYDDYVVPEINIYKLDEQNNKMYCVTLYNAFPKVVNDIMLASNSHDLSRFQVVFSYEMWKSFVIEGQGYDMANQFLTGGRSGESFGGIVGSMPEIPGIDLDRIGGYVNAMGTGAVLNVLGKLKNPALLKDAVKRHARSAGSEILKGAKSEVSRRLPTTVKQIGGTVLGRIGGAFGL